MAGLALLLGAMSDPIEGSAVPARGAASREPARRWEWAFVSGNGRMGALVFGDPDHETIVANHCRLFLPLGTREILPDVAEHLPEVRRLVREKGYRAAYDFMLSKAKEQGYPGLSWTDPFHPGFELKIDMKAVAGLDGLRDVYVDLRHAERSTCGWGTARNGATVTGKPLAIGSAAFGQGIGTHAPAEIVYRAAGKYRWLTFHTGISAEMTDNGSVTVQVWLDGKKAHETPVMRIKGEPIYVSLPIKGVNEIRLVVTDAGNGVGADHACFGNLRLCVGEAEPKPDKPTPSTKPVARPSGYLRTEDFQTGEAAVRWREDGGAYLRRLFVSRPHNAIVLSITGPATGKLSCSLAMAPIAHKLIRPQIKTESGWITCHNVYVKGKGGYDGAVRVVARGGTAKAEGVGIRVSGADEVLVLMRIEPYVKPADSSIDRIKAALGKLPADYAALLAPHAKVHGEIFNRVSLDLGGGADRARTSDDLMAQARKDNTIPPALLEKIYDACRYVFICSAGDLPPNLQGIWTGTWKPAWSGDFTTDTNVQLAVAGAHSANMPELMEGFYRLFESIVPDCRENARKTYGCRGIFLPTRVSNTGLNLHWGNGWPGQFWTCGAGWMARWFYDHYLYTGDRDFLAKRAVPYLREVALFYEDFLFEDASGKYRFSPSFSAENGMGDNPTQDIAVAKEVLTNLIAACEELGIEADGVVRWQAMLAKLPPYLINAEGCLQEWATPGAKERHNHRHFSNLYPAIYSYEFSPEETPKLWKAAHVALDGRLKHWFRNPKGHTSSSHGRMHAALAAVYLGRGDDAWEILTKMVTGGSFYSSLVTSHNANHGILNVDANGAIPEVINNALVFSWRGTLDLLRALPKAMPRGTVRGLLARGQFRIDELTWDCPAGHLRLALTSGKGRTITLRLPSHAAIKAIRVVSGPAEIRPTARGANCRGLSLLAGRSATLEIEF